MVKKNSLKHKKPRKFLSQISKKEWKYILLITAIVTLLSLLPLILGYLNAPEGMVFMGIPVHVTDANNHLNLALQAKEGSILFANKFTGEDVPALIFNPYHLLIGGFSALFKTSIIFAYNFFGVLFTIIFLLLVYKFIGYFTTDKKVRLIAFILIALSNGFGFWWYLVDKVTGYSFSSVDTWLTEMNTFQSFDQPHFILSLILMLTIFIFAIRAFEERKIKDAVWAGVAGLILSLVHLFDIVTIAVDLSAWFLYRQIVNKYWSWKEFRTLAIIGALISPGVIYYAWVFLFNPAYAEWNSLNQTVTPPFIRIISGFGIVFFFGISYIWFKRKELFCIGKSETRNIQPELFLAVWVVVNFILIYAPINVQRRFIMGLHIPLCILSAIVLIKFVMPIIKNDLLKKITVWIIVIISFATTFYILSNNIYYLNNSTVGTYSNVKYLSQEDIEGLKWLDEHTNNEDVVLAPADISNYIPAVSGNKVYSGHWAQTIDYDKKSLIVKEIYTTGVVPASLPVKYVWMENDLPAAKTIQGTIVFSNKKISIYTS